MVWAACPELAASAPTPPSRSATRCSNTSLVGFNRAQRRTEHLFAAAQAAEGAAKIARARFDAGTIDFLALLDAERELLLARDRLAQGQTAAATSLVAVYRALAGGWR